MLSLFAEAAGVFFVPLFLAVQRKCRNGIERAHR